MSQYIYGKNTVIQYLKNKEKIEILYIQNNSKNDEIVKMAKNSQVKVEFLDKARMDKMANGNHQGVIASISDYRLYSLEEVLSSIPKDKQPLLLMLDGMEDPHNLGAILRSADATQVDGVILRKNRSASLNATVAKVSCGAINTVKVVEVNNLTETIKTLKKKGYWVYGADNNEALDYRSVDYNLPLVLVIGSEGFGISRLVRENLDYSVKLPMYGEISSLNASVATGIMLYQVINSRYPFQ